MNDRLKAHLALLGANLIYGGNYTIAKAVMPRLIQPFGFIVLRVLATTILLWLLWVIRPSDVRIARRDIPAFLACALTGVSFNQLFFFKGLSLTLPIHASLMMLTTPILITFIAAFLIRERITRYKLAGLLLGITGAVVLVAFGKKVQTAANTSLGDLFVFINSTAYSFYLVWVKPLMGKYRPLTVIRWVFTVGLFMVLPFGWGEFRQIPWGQFQAADWAAAGFVVICTTFLAYLFNIYALQKLSASTTGAYIYLQPLFAAIIAVSFFGEKLTWIKILSAVLIFAGVYLVSARNKRPVRN